MKFVKANIEVVICGLVALLAIGGYFWPVSGWNAKLQSEAQEQYNKVNAIEKLITTEQIPGSLKPLEGKVTAEDNVIKAKRDAIKNMKEQADEVIRLAALENQKNRMKMAGKPGKQHEVPLLSDNKEEDNFLPALNTAADSKVDAHQFKADYEKQFAAWVPKVVGSSVPGVPPTTAEQTIELDKQLAELKRRQAAQAPSLVGGNLGIAGMALPPAEKDRIVQALVLNRASDIRCYMDENALQKRDWFGKSNPPDEVQIFEAFVDTWFQQDVINAISNLNKTELSKLPREQQNVGRSPIKRLEGISVGGGQKAEGGLFLNPNAQGGNSGGAPAVAGSTELGRSLTGHVGTAEYDVVLMVIKVDLDPAYQNRFIDELYKQNNGYTVLNIKTTAIDPFEAASNGYIYGAQDKDGKPQDVQCVHLEIEVEGLLFRDWTKWLMPEKVRAALNVPTPTK